jgi:hypothetical protein
MSMAAGWLSCNRTVLRFYPPTADFAGNLLFCLSTVRPLQASIVIVEAGSIDGEHRQELNRRPLSGQRDGV